MFLLSDSMQNLLLVLNLVLLKILNLAVSTAVVDLVLSIVFIILASSTY
jgi:hypothetical protein